MPRPSLITNLRTNAGWLIAAATVPLVLAISSSRGGALQDDDAGAGPADTDGYSIGFKVGEQTRFGLYRDGVPVDADLVLRGFEDGLAGSEPEVPRERLEGILAAVHEELRMRRVNRLLRDSPQFRELHDDKLRKSQAFHEIFGKQEGVTTLTSGVQYKVLVPGSGPTPGPRSTVRVTGKITLLDGTVLHEGRDIDVRVDASTPGGREILKMMSAGARWQVAIPPARAFGPSGRYPDIGPNETLVGIVELVEIMRP
jgi:FKBP-type peptidyl-prolyl cis-trans isomerase FklB